MTKNHNHIYEQSELDPESLRVLVGIFEKLIEIYQDNKMKLNSGSANKF